MNSIRFSIAVLALGLAVVVTADDAVEKPVTKINPEPPISTSPSPPTTKPPTTKPTTAPPTTSPPTTAPTTKPTTQPTTTTVQPNTTTTSTTPEPPTPTTLPPPVTTPKPNPPEEGTWEVISTGNYSCILLHMMAVVDVYYKADNRTYVDQYSVPHDANATGSCGEKEQKIKLAWGHNATTINSVEFVFKKNDTKFDLETVSLNVTVDNHENSTALITVNRTKEEFTTPIKMSYRCKKGQLLNFTLPTNETIASLHISNVQFQAFGNITKQVFAEAKDCEPYETPDIVPIAVGCALIALILFVLIGYLIGRRRNQARGYLSMFTTNDKKEADYIPMKNLSCFQ